MKYWKAAEIDDFQKFQKYTISQVMESARWTKKRTSDADGNRVLQEGHKSKKKRLNKNDWDMRLKDNDLRTEEMKQVIPSRSHVPRSLGHLSASILHAS
jgi:hypothetical protein